MRWRQLPELQTGLLHATRVLILGSGTLGCNIARVCLGWGMRRFTFVDQSCVSPSNPVRQPLFEFDDVKKPKAEAAAAALRRIFPAVEAKGIQLSIPMPGHPIPVEAKDAFDRLQALVASHDVIFLGTDSRESRWLPTVMGVALQTKLVMNVALGFDSFLVMRHGVGQPHSLGCYFCHDVVAPENSLRDRTLDQMCTVTRPGLAPAAAALAVELVVAVLHHPDKHLAPAYASRAGAGEVFARTDSTFGVLPHQIRGFLTHFGTVLPKTCAFHQCTACSPEIIREYEQHGFDFLTRVCASPSVLEHVTGLDRLRLQVDDLDFDLDLSD